MRTPGLHCLQDHCSPNSSSFASQVFIVMASFAVVLVFMAMGGVLAAEAAGRPSGTLAWNSNHNNNDAAADRLNIPAWLAASDSPLDTDSTAKYLTQVRDTTLSQHGKDFCQEAKLQCQSDISIVDPTFRISQAGLQDQELLQRAQELVDATRAMQFDRDTIQKGRELEVPETLRDSHPINSFLPQSIAENMPLTSTKMPEILDSMNIEHGSNMASMMARTVGQCETLQQQVHGKCVSSLQDMKTFVGARLPQDKRIAALERSSSIPAGAATSGKDDSWKVLDSTLYDRAVVCRNSVYPYAVFQCRDTAETKMHIYQVEMQRGSDGARIHEVAACRQQTNGDAADTNQACHWLTDSLVWAPTN